MSAIPPPVQTVLDLFSTELAEVRFGDVDARSLASAAAAVEAAAAEVAAAETIFAEARARLVEQQDALLQHVHHGLAYARVYAESDADLSARLDAMTLPRSTRRVRASSDSQTNTKSIPASVVEMSSERRPRGRPRKSPIAAEPLLEGVGGLPPSELRVAASAE